MSDDWARLTQVREAQLAAARAAVQRERDALAEGQQQVGAAQSALAAEQQAKQTLWQQTMQPTPGGCGVGQLRQAHAWSGALDQRITRAQQGVQAAHTALHGLQRQLDAREAELRHAHAQVEKVKQVASRLHREALRARDAREEGRLDDTAAERWLHARRS